MNKEAIKSKSELTNAIKNNKDQENKLEYALTILGLNQLLRPFLSLKITFADLIQMTKKDVIRFDLELYQRNRLCNFIQCYNKAEIKDSFKELKKFFINHKQFDFYNKLQSTNYEKGCMLTAKFFNEENDKKDIHTLDDYISFKDLDRLNLYNSNNTNNEVNIEDYLQSNDKVNSYCKSRSNNNQYQNINCNNGENFSLSRLIKNSSPKRHHYVNRSKTNPLYASSYMYNDSIYLRYLNVNKNTDEMLEKLNKSKKERHYKHAKYHLLLNQSGVKTTHRSQHSSQYNMRNSTDQFQTFDNDGMFSNNNTKSPEIDKLAAILNKKKQLQDELNKCNKSIHDNRKVFSHYY